MSLPRLARRARSALPLALLAFTLGATVAAPLPTASAGGGSEWLKPVQGAVVRSYKEPIARYAAGHRGVDFAAAPGTQVRAANDGRVTFAGTVAGAQHVVIAHDGGVRTSYSFLAGIDVRGGESVQRGQVIGTAGGTGESHGPGVLHLGARIGDRYIDPMLLFGPTDLTELVRLVPADERDAAEDASSWDEIRELRRELGGRDCAGPFGFVPGANAVCEAVSDAAGWTWDRLHDALDLGLEVLRAAGDAARALADELEDALHELLARLPSMAKLAAGFILRATPLGRALLKLLVAGKALYELGSALYEYATQDCDSDARPANGRGGSGNWVMAVGGIDSQRQRTRKRDGKSKLEPSFGFKWRRLGYERDDVEWFSYRDGSTTYAKRDTYGEVMRGAALLAEQLRERAIEHPGQPVDLVGHSLGGRVVRAFLEFYWKGNEAQYPQLGNVVFYASPQKGAPGAGAVQALRDIPAIDLTFAAMDAADAPGFDLRSPALEDLDPTSQQSRYFATHPPPAGVKVLTLAGSLDFVVPPEMTGVDRAQEFVTNVGAWHPGDDHSGILHDDEALSAHRAFLEGRKLPCTGLGDAVLGAAGSLVFGDVVKTLSART